MPVPYISLYIPTRPLLIWTLVTGGCGLLLAIEALVLAVRGMRGARWFALAPLVAGTAALVLADRIWAAYFSIACPYPGVLSRPLHCFNPDRAAQAMNRFQPLGWTTVAVTVILLIVGAVRSRPARHHTPVPA